MEKLRKFIKDENGLETVEYAIIGGLITVAAIAAITAVGEQVGVKFGELLAALM